MNWVTTARVASLRSTLILDFLYAMKGGGGPGVSGSGGLNDMSPKDEYPMKAGDPSLAPLAAVN